MLNPIKLTMKKINVVITILVIIIATNKHFSQSIINDKDGFVNVRKEASKVSKVIDTLKKGHLIYDLEREGQWVMIDYYKNNKSFSGYIYNDRFKRIAEFKEIKRKSINTNEVVLSNDSIEIKVTKATFEPKKHHFTYSKENKKVITLIDKKHYYGTDGEVPKTQYEAVQVKINDKLIQLPKSATENLYEPSLQNITVHHDEKSNTIYIDAINSDGAGGYVVVWKIKNGKFDDRYIFYGF